MGDCVGRCAARAGWRRVPASHCLPLRGLSKSRPLWASVSSSRKEGLGTGGLGAPVQLQPAGGRRM